MTKLEVEVLLRYLESRLKIVKEQISMARNNFCLYLVSADIKDVIHPSNALNSMTYTTLINRTQEELALQHEIAKLKKVLGR